jgi:hypothetical protein
MPYLKLPAHVSDDLRRVVGSRLGCDLLVEVEPVDRVDHDAA